MKVTERRAYSLQMVELGFEPQPWVQEITLYTMFLPTWRDDSSREEGKTYSTGTLVPVCPATLTPAP